MKVNGAKTYIGLALWGIGSIVEIFFPPVGIVLRVVGEALTGIGAAHKLVKGVKE